MVSPVAFEDLKSTMASETMTIASASENVTNTLAAPETTHTPGLRKNGVAAWTGERDASGLVQQWHSQPRKLRIIHVGAGATGLCTAYKMRNQLQDYELVCYEKNASIGGTWLESTLD